MKRKTISIFLTTILSTLLVSCSIGNTTPDYQATFQPEVTKTETGNTRIITENFTAVILTKEFYESHERSYANKYWTSKAEYWTPEVNQVLFLEAHLEEYLAQNESRFNSGHAPSKDKLVKYGRQYYGTTEETENNERMLVGNFFCLSSIDQDWGNYIVSAKGGGDCFFYVWYNVEKQEFFAVGANTPE